MKYSYRQSKLAYCLLAGALIIGPSGNLLANGTEILGTIATEPGSRLIAAGVGLEQSQVLQTIDFTIPGDATIKQVFAYWEGNSDIASPPATNTILIAGQNITGEFIGGRKQPDGLQKQFLTYRADITANGIVGLGPNSILVSGMTFDTNNGAGILVIIEDGTSAFIEIRTEAIVPLLAGHRLRIRRSSRCSPSILLHWNA
jgi:hypothetical protein